jgi:hypothetical protein
MEKNRVTKVYKGNEDEKFLLLKLPYCLWVLRVRISCFADDLFITKKVFICVSFLIFISCSVGVRCTLKRFICSSSIKHSGHQHLHLFVILHGVKCCFHRTGRTYIEEFEVTGGWRTVNNVELHDFYSSPNIITNLNGCVVLPLRLR